MKNLAVLERRPVDVPELEIAKVSKEVVELGEQAKRTLGYYRLSNDISTKQAAIKNSTNTMTLAQTLKELQIEPFTDRAVEEYQDAQLTRTAGFMASHPICRILTVMFGWPFCYSLGIMAVLIYSQSQSTPDYHLIRSSIICGIAAAIFGILAAWAAHKREVAKRWSWQTIEISQYQAEIPAFVLRKAIAIKERLPDAKFAILQLVYQKPEKQPVYADPFLRVKYNDLEYYIEVWDEPKFEATI